MFISSHASLWELFELCSKINFDGCCGFLRLSFPESKQLIAIFYVESFHLKYVSVWPLHGNGNQFTIHTHRTDNVIYSSRTDQQEK